MNFEPAKEDLALITDDEGYVICLVSGDMEDPIAIYIDDSWEAPTTDLVDIAMQEGNEVIDIENEDDKSLVINNFVDGLMPDGSTMKDTDLLIGTTLEK